MSFNLTDFITESLRIEGIHRKPTKQEIDATESFIELKEMSVGDICGLVNIYQPYAILRNKLGLDVRIGNYFPPKGGKVIEDSLKNLVEEINSFTQGDAYYNHCRYEKLHPFTDGNGRSGRSLWLWEMKRLYPHKYFPAPLGFLHTFYYQSLSSFREYK